LIAENKPPEKGSRHLPLLRLALQQPLPLGITAALAFTSGLLTIGQAYLLSQVIAGVFLEGWDLSNARQPIWWIGLLILGRLGLNWGQESASAWLSRRIRQDLRRQAHAALLAQSPLKLQAESTGSLVHTLIQGIETLDVYYAQYLPQIIQTALIPVSILVAAFSVDWLSGLILLLTGPLIPLFMQLVGSMSRSVTRRQWEMLRSMSAYFLDVIQGLVTLKLLNRSKDQVRTIAQVGERFRQVTMQVLRLAFLSALTLELLSTLSTAVIAVQIGLRLLYGGLPFVTAFFVLVLAPEYYAPFRQLGLRFHAAMPALEAAPKIFDLIARAVPQQPPQSTPMRMAQMTIRFDQVSCSYQPGSPVLQEVSLELPAGRLTALVGPSGAGKSTLAALLLRFASPDGGRITVNGQDLAALEAQAWRSQVAWVPQAPHFFAASVLENIALARPDASRAEVIAAAQHAQADEFIQHLPQGYDTPLAEGARSLSAGQRQRIALARAFLKDAPLLILDEPTANLDAASEHAIQQSLQALAGGRTVLVIAHRLNTILRADQVLVMQAGRVVQHGAPGVLAGQKGLFQDLLSVWRSEAVPAPLAQPPAPSAPPGGAQSLAAQEQAAPLPSSPAQVLRRLLGFLAPFSPQVLLAVLLGAAATASSIGLMATSAYILSAAALQPSIAVLQVPIVGVRFFGLARGVLRYLERLVSHDLTFRLLARLRLWFYQAIEPLAPARLVGSHSGDLLSRVVDDIASLEDFYVRGIAPPLSALLVSLFASLLVGAYFPLLGWVLLGGLALAGLGLPLLMRALSRRAGKGLAAARGRLSMLLVEQLQGLADLQVLGQAARARQEAQIASQELYRRQFRLAQLAALQNALTPALAQASMLAVLALAIEPVRAGLVAGVTLGTLALAALTSFESVQGLPLAAQNLENNLGAAARLFDLASLPPAVTEPASPQPLVVPRSIALEIQHVHFQYPASRLPALADLSLNLPAGMHAALVGPSGAGKSSLALLLARGWEYQQGQILLGGTDLRQYASEDARRLVALVPQQPYLFHSSLRQNLLVACPQADQAALDRALQAASLESLVRSLPQGDATLLDEHGARLSAGEAQRLSIARGLLQDAPLLILDEAASHLDPLLEQELMRSLRRLRQGRTTLWITHRLAGIHELDEIFVLDQGRLVEQGSHTGLINAGGLYARLWALQQIS
jgi:ATP-binding cassette subfamily C protein CydCD